MNVADATPEGPTGLELCLQRKSARVTQRAIAERLGVSRGRVATIETYPYPPITFVVRYLVALVEVMASR